MRTILACILSLVILQGCSTSGRTLDVITSATNLSYHYTNGNIVTFVGNVQLSNLEVETIVKALDEIDDSKNILMNYKDEPTQLVLHIPEITTQYMRIKSAYLDIRNVVMNHVQEYSHVELQTFVEFDNAAKTLDEEFLSLLDTIETNRAIYTALSLANTAAKIGAML